MGAVRASDSPHRRCAQPAPVEALRRARCGDERGFTELYVELQPRLLRYLSVRCGDSAQDVASETWASVIADLHKFRGNADNFVSWLFSVARCRAADAARTARHRPQTVAVEFDMEDPRCRVEDAVVAEAFSITLLRALHELSAEQAEAVALRVVAELDVATVAQLLGKSEAAIRVHTHRGLRRLAALLHNNNEGAA